MEKEKANEVSNNNNNNRNSHNNNNNNVTQRQDTELDSVHKTS